MVSPAFEIMSDDEGGAPREKRPRIYFGSLEESERQRLSKASAAKPEDGGRRRENGISELILAGIQAGNINIAEGKCEVCYFVYGS